MKKSWWQSGIFTLLFHGSSLAFAFFSFLVLVRVLSPKDMGIWALYLAVTSFTEMLRNGITQNALLKYIAGKTGEEYRRIASASLFIKAATALICFLCILGLASFLANLWQVPELKHLLPLYGIYLLVNVPLTFLQFICIAKSAFKARFVSNLANQGANLIMVVGCFLLFEKVDLQQLPLIQAVAAFVGLLILLLGIGSEIKLSPRIDWQWVLKLFHFGKYVFATSVGAMLFKRTDLAMIGYFINPVAVAIYSVATRISNYVDVPINAMADIVFPKAAERFQKDGKEAVRYLYEKSVGTLMAILMPLTLVLVFLAKPIVLLIAGEAYVESVPVLRLLALLSIVRPFGRQGGVLLDSMGYPNYNFYSFLVSIALNIVLNWYLIPLQGIAGAVNATVIAVTVGVLVQQAVLLKLIGIRMHHPIIYMWVTYVQGVKHAVKILSGALGKPAAGTSGRQ